MTAPYRVTDPPPARPPVRPHEERVLGWALLSIAVLRLAIAAALGQAWTSDVLVAALLLPIAVRLIGPPRFPAPPSPAGRRAAAGPLVTRSRIDAASP